MSRRVAVLFARADSIYKRLPGCDVFDLERDARSFCGGAPVVAHPPCRAWGQLRHFAKPVPGERELALFAVDRVRRFGGVLEHPVASQLWPECSLPSPGARDSFGGFTFPIDQDWFGHVAQKRTRLYVCGCEPCDLPAFPLVLEDPSRFVEDLSRAGRERTPVVLARWLLAIARLCSPSFVRVAA